MKPGASQSKAGHLESPPPSADFKTRLIEGSPDCIKVLDLDGRLLSMNAGGMAVLEICDLKPFIGSAWVDFWQGEDRKAAQAAVNTARDGGLGRFVGFFPTTQTHKPMWFDVVVSPINDANGKPEKLLAASRDVTQWKRAENLLHAIVDGTSTATGDAYFRSLLQRLARGLGVRYAFVAECLTGHRARSLAFWNNDAFADNFEYDLRGTPCLKVTDGQTCHYDRNLQKLFPEDKPLVEMRAESYLGVPVRDSTQHIIGHLVIIDDKPLASDPLVVSVMTTFANRAGVELERVRAFDHLHREKQESDERFRDLFDEAPIAYVHEGLDSKFIRADRAALRSFGIKPEEVEGTYGKDFVPNTPDAQRRLREAFESIGRGTDTSGVVLELRRKDNGKPLWIQWWSKPDPSGTYTRTMFVDITERVLMEQEKARLEAQNTYLQEEIQTQHNFEEIIGSSPAIKKVLKNVETVAPTDSTVLIAGETGTGKELIARAIHNLSRRKDRVLVKVNCAAIPAGLIESELFGHEKGAFTGALSRKLGRFELADGATIFLDEIGDLPLDLQAKLLRVLQEGEFERLGNSRTLKVNVRVVAATNRELEKLTQSGGFRHDLYYRLNVFPIRLPALRERKEDIPLLVRHFVRTYATKMGKKIETIPQSFMQALQDYPWPGNVRELANVIERAVILTAGPILELGEWRAKGPTPVGGQIPTLEELEQQHIISVLDRTGWRVSGEKGAAHLLGLKPTTLEARMKKLGITRKAS